MSTGCNMAGAKKEWIPITVYEEQEIITGAGIPRSKIVGKKRYRLVAVAKNAFTRDRICKNLKTSGWKFKTQAFKLGGGPVWAIYTDEPRSKDPYGWL